MTACATKEVEPTAEVVVEEEICEVNDNTLIENGMLGMGDYYSDKKTLDAMSELYIYHIMMFI